MGSAVCRAVAIDPDLELVAAVDPRCRRAVRRVDGRVTIAGELRAFADAACDVVVDFTVAAAARVTLPWLAMHGVHAVVGTTGLDDDDVDAVPPRVRRRTGPLRDRTELRHLGGADDALRRDGRAVLRFGRDHRAAPRRQGRRPVGHRRARPPSGSPRRRRSGRPTRPSARCYPGARGGLGPAGIRVHSVRMRGMVAHQEVILGSPRSDADDPPGQLRPRQLHAGRDPRLQAHRRPPRRHARPRPPPRPLVPCRVVGMRARNRRRPSEIKRSER